MNDDLEKSITAYDNLLNTAYHFILGRKKQTVEIELQFTSKELFHLLGLQYLKLSIILDTKISKFFGG